MRMIAVVCSLFVLSVAARAQSVTALPGLPGERLNQDLVPAAGGRGPSGRGPSPSSAIGPVRPEGVVFVGDNVFPHFIDGGSWQTVLLLTNLDTKPLHFRILFFQDNGDDMMVPIVGVGLARGLDVNLNVHGTITIATQGDAPNLSAGWAYLLKDTMNDVVGGNGVFRARVDGRPDFEAAVPLASQFDSHFVMMFDNTNGFGTGMAMANPSNQRVSIPVTIYDGLGSVIDHQTIALGPFSHVAFMVPSAWRSTAGVGGSIEFVTSGYGVAVLALRFNPGGAFTSFNVLSNLDWLISSGS